MTAEANASTGIVLICDHRSGEYALTRTGRPTLRYSADTSLADISVLAGLLHGYWLRSTPTPTATTWTWVQL